MALYNKSCFFNTVYKIRFIHIALLLKRGCFMAVIQQALSSQFYPRDLNGVGFSQGSCSNHSGGKDGLAHDTLVMTIRFIMNRTCLPANIPHLQLQYENKVF